MGSLAIVLPLPRNALHHRGEETVAAAEKKPLLEKMLTAAPLAQSSTGESSTVTQSPVESWTVDS